MKSIKLTLITIISLFLTANVFGQEINPFPQTRPNDAGGEYLPTHVVAKASSFKYSVKLNSTFSFKDDKNNDNWYQWALYEYSDVAPYHLGAQIFLDAKKTSENFRDITWDDVLDAGLATGKVYVVVVTEWANHGTEAPTVDERAFEKSSIIVKIGEDLQIYIMDNDDNKDFYACDGEYKTVDEFSDAAKPITLKFNGRKGTGVAPEIDGWKVTFNVASRINGITDAIGVDVVLPITGDLVAGADGYFTYDVDLKVINTLLPAGNKMTVDASSSDVYYKVTVKSFEHGDGSNDALADAANNKKVFRTFGIYTKPKVTRIHFK